MGSNDAQLAQQLLFSLIASRSIVGKKPAPRKKEKDKEGEGPASKVVIKGALHPFYCM